MEKVRSVLEWTGQLEECVLPIGLGRWKVTPEMDSGVESVKMLEKSVSLAEVEPEKRGIRLALAL